MLSTLLLMATHCCQILFCLAGAWQVLEVCPPSQAILDFHVWAWLLAMPCLAALPILSPPLGCTIFTNCSRYLPGFLTGMLERGIFNNNNDDYHRFRYFSLIITS